MIEMLHSRPSVATCLHIPVLRKRHGLLTLTFLYRTDQLHLLNGWNPDNAAGIAKFIAQISALNEGQSTVYPRVANIAGLTQHCGSLNNLHQFFVPPRFCVIPFSVSPAVTAVIAGYPGGLAGYKAKAQELLHASATGDNPFEGMTPEIPMGCKLHYGDEEFEKFEEGGLAILEHVGFVLVAGGRCLQPCPRIVTPFVPFHFVIRWRADDIPLLSFSDKASGSGLGSMESRWPFPQRSLRSSATSSSTSRPSWRANGPPRSVLIVCA